MAAWAGTNLGVLLFLWCSVIYGTFANDVQQPTEPAESDVYRGTPLIDLFEEKQAFFQIKTPASQKLYKYIWMTTESQQLRLRIKGTQGAHIALAKTPRITTGAYEVIIGRGSQQTIDILDKVDGSIKNKTSVPNAINANTFSDFWITWSEGVIRVGQGSVNSQKEKVSWKPPGGLKLVTAVSMDTYTNSMITWRFLRDSARDLWLWSRGSNSNSDIWFSEPVRQYFTFGAKGCAEAKVGLSDGPGLGSAGQYQTYVVVLGNQKDESVIKSQIGGDVAASASTPGILSCSEMRYFWIRWETGYIQVGKGLRIGDNMFLNWLPHNPHNVTSVTPFFGSGAGTDPEFHFRNVEENYYLLKSESMYNFNTSHAINVEQRSSFVFRVHACYDAVLNLRRKFAEHTAGTPHNIRVTLGTSSTEGNKTHVAFVWADGTGDMTFDYDTPDILSCHEFRHLWLAWHNAYIRVGRGDEPYVNQIFQMRDPYLPFSIESLHLASLTEEYKVVWQFSRSQAKSIAIPALPLLGDDQAWLSAAERTDFFFKVKGKDMVKLLLTSFIDNSEIAMYTIQISNLAIPDSSAIWRENDKAGAITKASRNIINEDLFMPFWVSWTGNKIQFGKGVDIGRSVVVNFPDKSPSGLLEINAISFAGTTTGISTWEVGAEEGPQYTVYTPPTGEPDKYSTFWMVPNVYILPFKLKAEKLAYIKLAPYFTASTGIEIAIGKDGGTEISELGTDNKVRQSTEDILNKGELRPLWVSWFNKTVQVGRGVPLQGVVATLQLDTLVVGAIGLASTAAYPSPSAEWIFGTDLATEIKMTTKNEYKYNQLWIDTAGRTSQVFRVQATSDANIALALTSEKTNSDIYEVTIGKDNKETLIRDGTHLGIGFNVKARVNTSGILSGSEMRTFWVSWANKEVRVGRGPEVGVDTIVSWLDKKAHSVHALAIATESASTGAWELFQLKGEVYHMATFPNVQLSSVMTTQNDHISFSIYGCSPASILLLEDPTPTPSGYNMYEIIIGKDNDSHVAIYKAMELNWKLLKAATFSDVLTCGVKTDFWVRWRNNLIQLGRGVFPHNVIIQKKDNNAPNPVNAFSFGNGVSKLEGNYPLRWEFDKGAVHTISYRTLGPKAYQDGMWMSVYKQDFLVFSVVSCSTVSIVMSEDAAISSLSAYEIDIGITYLYVNFTIYKDGTQVHHYTKSSVVNCHKERYYWIGWRNGLIEIGYGSLIGGTNLISYNDTNPHDVNFVGFTSDNDTLWNLRNVQGDVFGHQTGPVKSGQTPSYKDLWMVPLRHVQAVSFTATGCAEARIALSAEANSIKKAYEVVLDQGGKKFTHIRQSVNGPSMANRSGEALLDCKNERRFWVSWEDNVISVGHGNIGTYKILQWKVPLLHRHKVQAVGFGSGTNKAINWHFDVNDAEGMHGFTKNSSNDQWRIWQTVSGQNRMVFQVKTSKAVRVMLTSMLYESTTEAYIITLKNDNKYGQIVDASTGLTLASGSLPGSPVDSNQYKTFWIQWSEMAIEVGSGGYIGKGILLRAYRTYAPYLYPISSVGFDGMEADAYWTFLRAQGEVYRTYTSTERDYGVSTINLQYREYYTFSLRACSDAYILLGSASNGYENDLELIIGSYDNTMVELRYVALQDPEVIVDAEGILSCSQLRRFWISWISGEIKFGQGNLGEREVLVWQFHDPGGSSRPFDMEYIQLATLGYQGEWELEQTGTMNTCEDNFEMIASSAEMVKSGCPLKAMDSSAILKICIESACLRGATLVEYSHDSGNCYIRRCADPDDHLLSKSDSGYDIWAIDYPRDTFTAKTSKQLGLNYDQHWITVIGFQSLSFKVKACAEVHLALAAIPANSETMSYEVVIGGWANSASAIRTKAGILEAPVVQVPTPGVLQCSTFQHMWVSWMNGRIEAGKGSLVGEEPFISWNAGGVNLINPINAVGLSTATDVEGTFIFGNLEDVEPPAFSVEDEYYVMRTTGSGDTSGHRWTISKAYLRFKLAACSDARIILATIPDNHQTGVYTIDLGYENNQKTSISKLGDPSKKQEATTPDVLNCTEVRDFWLQWTRTGIALGSGKGMGLNTLVSLADTLPEKFNELAVTTTTDVKGYWEVSKSEGHIFIFKTPNTEQYNEIARSTSSANSIVFKVKAPNDAHILLSRHLNDLKDVYEVALGIHANTYSVIRKCKQCKTLASADNAGVLSGTELRAFWIRWYQGIEVGYGTTVGRDPMMRLHELGSGSIEAMSVMTGWGATGCWHFSDIDGEGFFLSPPPSLNYGHIWMFEQTHFFELSVKSCDSAWIYLANVPMDSMPNQAGYDIHLEGGEDTLSQILRYPREEGKALVRANATTPAVVDCNSFNRIWVSWKGGLIKVGYGTLLDNTFLYYRDPIPFEVRTLGLRTPTTQTVNSEWQFRRDAAKSVIFNTFNGKPFMDWYTVDEVVPFTYVRITGCQDVELLLSSSPGVTYGHRIVLGKDNKTTVMYAADDVTIVSTKPINPLVCAVGEWFWVSWADNKIAMGLGFESGSDVVAYYDMDNEREEPFEIRAIGFRGDHDVDMFEFSPFEGKEFEVKTLGGDKYKDVWLLTKFIGLTFKVQTCESAKIALSEDSSAADIVGTNAYELIIGANQNQCIELWKHHKDSTNSTLIDTMDFDSIGPLLDCGRSIELWLMWGLDEGVQVLRLGRGPELLDLQFYTHSDVNDAYPITSIGLASEDSDNGAKWRFKHNAAALTKFRTDVGYNYGRFLYHVATVRSFVFKVRAPQDAHIVLTEQYLSEEAYEFVIGMSGNTYTAIRVGKLSTPVAWASTPNVLSETEYRLFWVSWSNTRLAIGRGNIPGWNEIVGHDTNAIKFIQYLGITTWANVIADWEYVPQLSNTLLLATPSDPDQTTMTISFYGSQYDFTFEVRACAEAQIRLKADADSSTQYELIIGADDNTKTKLYKNGRVVHEVKTPDVLHCTESRQMWLSWKDGFFDLARGSQAGLRILEWEDPASTPVHSLSMATGRTYTGDWSIARYQAPLVRFIAYPHRNYEGFWMTVSELKSYVFRIKSSSSASILLTDVPGVSTRFAYEIQIGIDFNTYTRIKRINSDSIISSSPTPGILSGREFRWFWVSWGHFDENLKGMIKFGKGLTPGQDQVIMGYAQDPIEINGLGFAAKEDKNVTWELTQNTEGNYYQLKTDGLTYDDGAWIHPIDRFLRFDVKACQDASIALLTDRAGTVGYELVLGYLSNTGAALFIGLDRVQTARLEVGQGKLDCGLMKKFWISWDGSNIRVGEGYDDTTPFLSYSKLFLDKINVLGFKSDNLSNAEWRIPQDQENALLLSTAPDVEYSQHWVTLAGRDRVVFRVKECNIARVMLVGTPDDVLQATEVVIGIDGKTEIHDKDGSVKMSVPTPDVLDCDHFKAFWIYWESTKIHVGKGSVTFAYTILVYENNVTLHDIGAMSLATGIQLPYGSMAATRGHWQIFGLRGNVIKVFTEATKSYDILDLFPKAANRFELTFRVRTCDSAQIMFAPQTGTASQSYEVVIGSNNNERWEIRKGGVMVKKAVSFNILSDKQFRSFWVSWDAGNLTAGWGEFGERHAISYYDSNAVTMYGAAFSTWDNCPGNWDIDRNVGDSIQVHTPGSHKYDRLHIMVMDIYNFVFKVKASHSVHIALSVAPTMTSTETWEIGLQAIDQHTNFIREVVNGSTYLVKNNRGPYLDKDNYQTFWLSWESGRIALGEGQIIGTNEIIAVNKDNIPGFSSISFATALAIPADWQMTFTDGDYEGPTTTAATTPTTTTKTTPTTITTTPTTTTTTRTTTTTTSPLDTTTTTAPTTTTANTGSSTTDGAENPNQNTAGLAGGQVAGIVIGVLILLILIALVGFLGVLRYKPDSIPREVMGSVPTSLQRKVRRDPNSVPVHFTNPVFGGDEALSQNVISYGTSSEGEPLNDFKQGDT